MRKIFIDGGANNGNSIELFLDKYPNSNEFEIHSFECNPTLFEDLGTYSEKATIHQKALSTRPGVSKFFLGENLSSTLREDKLTGTLDISNPIEVELVDLAKFIKENFQKTDYIVVKLDVEGSEYDLIPHLLKEGLFDGWIDELFGEWHFEKLNSVSKEQHLDLMYQIYSKGIRMKDWCAESGIIAS
jgi:FkbM family methyltransferase